MMRKLTTGTLNDQQARTRPFRQRFLGNQIGRKIIIKIGEEHTVRRGRRKDLLCFFMLWFSSLPTEMAKANQSALGIKWSSYFPRPLQTTFASNAVVTRPDAVR